MRRRAPQNKMDLTAYARIFHHSKFSRSSSRSVGSSDRLFWRLELTRIICGADATDDFTHDGKFAANQRGERKCHNERRADEHLGRRTKEFTFVDMALYRGQLKASPAAPG